MVDVIIVMAGSGSRMELNENKVLLPLGGKPIFMHSVTKFLDLGCNVILVIRECDYDKVKTYVNDEVKIVYGGKTRSESVYNGLKEASGEIVLVHDAARPFIDLNVIKEAISKIDSNNAVFVGKKAIDTIRQKTSKGFVTLNREDLVYAQTPQGAMTKILLKAYEIEKEQGFKSTDEMAIIEKYTDLNVLLVLGNDLNFKITTKKDYALAKELVGE